jgi:hypothetical protein
MRTRFMLWAIWGCFLARALFYCSAVPLWEGYDEYSHFDLIRYVAMHHGSFPLGAVPPDSSRAVSESRRLTPGAWLIHDSSKGVLSYEEYFALPLAEQNARRARLEKLQGEETDPREPLYEAQQAPLYYWMLAPIYGLIGGLSLPGIVWILRCLTVLIASAVVPLAFHTGRLVFRDDRLALGAALVVASFPELFIVIGHVGNEGLCVVIGALVVFLALRPSRGSGVQFGIALGAALLTKAYFLALVPLAVVALCRMALRSRVAAVVSCAAVCGWWYVHNVVVTGTLTGQLEDGLAAKSSVSFLRAVGEIRWGRVFDFVVLSHIWLGDWSFLVVRTWMYRVVELMIVAAIAGVCVQVVRDRSGLPRPKELGLLALPYLVMVAGLGFHAVQVFRAGGAAGTMGYYLYGLVVPEAVLLIAGIARMIRLWAVPVVVFVLIGLEQFGAWFVLFPYYGGLIRHNAAGGLPTARIWQFGHGGIGVLFDHLSGIGPVSSPSVVATGAVLYVFATVILIWLACRIAVRAD